MRRPQVLDGEVGRGVRVSRGVGHLPRVDGEARRRPERRQRRGGGGAQRRGPGGWWRRLGAVGVVVAQVPVLLLDIGRAEFAPQLDDDAVVRHLHEDVTTRVLQRLAPREVGDPIAPNFLQVGSGVLHDDADMVVHVLVVPAPADRSLDRKR